MRKKFSGMLVLATAAVAMGGVTTPASAAGWTTQYSAVVGSETYKLLYNGEVRGLSQAKSNATVTLYDRKGDGQGQLLYWRVNGATAFKSCVNEGGNNSQKTCNVTDNKFIQYQYCQKNGSKVLACTPLDGFQT